jgi:hypothetical protein
MKLVWGLGLEHEFLVSTPGPGGRLEAVLSESLFERDRPSRLPMMPPVIVEVGGGEARGGRRTAPRARRGASAWERVALALERAPLVLCLPHALGLLSSPHALREWTSLLQSAAPDTDTGRVQNFVRFVSMHIPSFLSDEWLGMLEGLSAAAKPLEARAAEVAIKVLEKEGASRASRAIAVCTHGMIPDMYVTGPGAEARDAEARDVLAALVECFVAALRLRTAQKTRHDRSPRSRAEAASGRNLISASNAAIDMDGSFVEVRSMDFLRATAEKVVSEVQRHEEAVLGAARRLCKDPGIFGQSGYAGLGWYNPESGERGEHLHDYAGSYHIWVTLPHAPAGSAAERNGVLRAHALMCHRLQWLEPLILSAMGGDPRAPGSGAMYPRASMRSSMNPLYGIGTSDARALLKTRRQVSVSFYAGTREAVSGIAALAAPGPFPGDRSAILPDVRLWSRSGGSDLRYYGVCEDQSRWPGGAHDHVYVHTGDNAGTRLLPAGQPYQRGLVKAGAAYHVAAGSDIRTRLCETSRPWALAPSPWKPVFVGRPGGRDLDLYYYSVGDAGVELRREFPAASKPPLALAGIEFRLLDNLPSGRVMPFVRAVCLVGAGAARDAAAMSPEELEAELELRAGEDRGWTRAVVAVSTGGGLARLDPGVLGDMMRRIGLDGGSATPDPPSASTAFDGLCRVCRGLQASFGGLPDAKRLLGGRRPVESDVVPDCWSWLTWKGAFEGMLAADPSLLGRLARAPARPGKPAALAGRLPPGWSLDRPFLARWLAERAGGVVG